MTEVFWGSRKKVLIAFTPSRQGKLLDFLIYGIIFPVQSSIIDSFMSKLIAVDFLFGKKVDEESDDSEQVRAGEGITREKARLMNNLLENPPIAGAKFTKTMDLVRRYSYEEIRALVSNCSADDIRAKPGFFFCIVKRWEEIALSHTPSSIVELSLRSDGEGSFSAAMATMRRVLDCSGLMEFIGMQSAHLMENPIRQATEDQGKKLKSVVEEDVEVAEGKEKE